MCARVPAKRRRSCRNCSTRSNRVDRKEYQRQYYLRTKDDPKVVSRRKAQREKLKVSPKAKAYHAAYRAKRRLDPEVVARNREYNTAWGRRKRADPQRRALESDRNKQRRYQITQEKLDSLRGAHSGCCWICKSAIRGKNEHVDHCHTTGFVRGILCASCNKGLGCFQDRPELLAAAAQYLLAAQTENGSACAIDVG